MYLKKIYNDVYDKLKKSPKYPFQRMGRLYYIIDEILGQLDSEESRQEVIKCIGTELKVTDQSFSSDDDKIVEDLSKMFLADSFVAKIGHAVVDGTDRFITDRLAVQYNNQNTEDEDSMKWLVFSACMLVGFCACVQYLEGRKKQAQNRQASLSSQRSTPSSNKPPTPTSASLCLVVPASEVSFLQVGFSIVGGKLAELINSASYFLCKSKKEAEGVEEGLVFTEEEILKDSPKKVYVRIAIPDGTLMIDKTTRYEIKENIEDSQQYKIEKLKCLWSLSGLESFILI